MRQAKKIFLIFMGVLFILPAPLLFFGIAFPQSGIGHRIIQPKLLGVVMETVQPDFSWQGLAAGTFQDAFAKWFNQRFALREFFIKMNNQLYYSLFDKTYMGDILVGKNRQLYGRGYVDEYCGIRPPMNDVEKKSIIKLMATAQQGLRERGIDFLVIVTPSKPDVMPNDVPKGYCDGRIRYSRNYDGMIPLMQEAGINYVDGQMLTIATQKNTQLPLFTQGGLHWNALGATGTVNAVMEKIGQLKSQTVGSLVIEEVMVDNRPTGADADLANLLNLIIPEDHYSTPHLRIKSQQYRSEQPLSAFMVGGSFSWLPLELISTNRLMEMVNFHYYYRGQHVLYMDGRKKTTSPVTDVTKLDYANYVLRHNVIIVEINTEAFTYPHARDFLKDLTTALQKSKKAAVAEPNEIQIQHDLFDAAGKLLLGPGWYDVEDVKGEKKRWMDGSASIVFFSGQPLEADFSMKVGSFYRQRVCRIYINEKLVSEIAVNTGAPQDIIWEGKLRKGENIIRIVAVPGGDIPAEVLKSVDRRKLALLVKEFQFQSK